MYLPDNVPRTDCGQSSLQNAVKCKSCKSVRNQMSSLSFLRLSFRIFAVILAGILILPCVSASTANADLETNAKVCVTSANIRSAPGTTAAVVATLPVNTRVAAGEVVNITADPSGKNTWCKISVMVSGTQIEGYIVNSFLLKDPTSDDPAFETAIAGFPDSYKPSLRSLHEAHPSWTFRAVNVGTDWKTVVASESMIGTSLITSSADDSWKSVDSNVYNWLTNTYTPYDGASWVNASKDVVAYYLDPRNFLSDTYIFQFLNLSYDAGTQTQDAVQKLLNNTFMAGTLITEPVTGAQISYAQAFMQAGAASGSSPYQLVSRIVQEVSATGSRSTSGTEPGYAGYYNYYNIGASSSTDPVILGLTFAINGSNNPGSYPMSAENKTKYLIPWNSPYKSIAGGAAYISSYYIQKGQNTMYFQKFDVTDDGNGMYRHQYMTNVQAMTGESTTLYNAYSKSSILDVPLTFSIPVYAAMPDTPAVLPAKTGNPNNYLASLSIDGFSLTPTFDSAVTEGYSLIVPFQVSSVNLTAAAVAATSTISGQGAVALNTGENSVPVTVTAQNGSARTYNITILRNEPTGEVLYTTAYRINLDNTLTGIAPGTSISAFTAGVTLQNGGQIIFLNAGGTIITDPAHILATGDRVEFVNSSAAVVNDYTVIVFGDSNGDGKINSTDLTVLCRHVLKESSLSGSALLAADVNHDGKTNSTDLTVICRYVLKESTITQ
ncbi:MAG: dockerin type I domain-containing protein [Eubacteriales bacterium]